MEPSEPKGGTAHYGACDKSAGASGGRMGTGRPGVRASCHGPAADGIGTDPRHKGVPRGGQSGGGPVGLSDPRGSYRPAAAGRGGDHPAA